MGKGAFSPEIGNKAMRYASKNPHSFLTDFQKEGGSRFGCQRLFYKLFLDYVYKVRWRELI